MTNRVAEAVKDLIRWENRPLKETSLDEVLPGLLAKLK